MLFLTCSSHCFTHEARTVRVQQALMGMGPRNRVLKQASKQRHLDEAAGRREAAARDLETSVQLYRPHHEPRFCAPKLAGPLRNSVPRSASGTSPSTSSSQYSNSLFWLVNAAAQSAARKRTPSARFGVPASGASGTGCAQQDARSDQAMQTRLSPVLGHKLLRDRSTAISQQACLPEHAQPRVIMAESPST